MHMSTYKWNMDWFLNCVHSELLGQSFLCLATPQPIRASSSYKNSAWIILNHHAYKSDFFAIVEMHFAVIHLHLERKSSTFEPLIHSFHPTYLLDYFCLNISASLKHIHWNWPRQSSRQVIRYLLKISIKSISNPI